MGVACWEQVTSPNWLRWLEKPSNMKQTLMNNQGIIISCPAEYNRPKGQKSWGDLCGCQGSTKYKKASLFSTELLIKGCSEDPLSCSRRRGGRPSKAPFSVTASPELRVWPLTLLNTKAQEVHETARGLSGRSRGVSDLQTHARASPRSTFSVFFQLFILPSESLI